MLLSVFYNIENLYRPSFISILQSKPTALLAALKYYRQGHGTRKAKNSVKITLLIWKNAKYYQREKKEWEKAFIHHL